MLVLALDTTTRSGSVALVDEERVIEERAGDASRTHAERLPAELVALVDAHHLTLAAIDVFAVAIGPGSFTGLRIGIATMQGLAFVNERPLAGVSTLEALAQLGSEGLPPGALVAAWVDAHRREVFSALYRVTARAQFEPDRLIELDAASVAAPSDTLARWADRLEPFATFVGDGATMYAEVIRERFASPRIEPAPLVAGAVGRLAIVRARRNETIGPSAVRPLYVRRPDAELARDKCS
jgi:tRNA threonylcarbamoyladenosine biosynthesis protein TsaB